MSNAYVGPSKMMSDSSNATYADSVGVLVLEDSLRPLASASARS
jgi:hypothetical protein